MRLPYFIPGEEVAGMVVIVGTHFEKSPSCADDAGIKVQCSCGHEMSIKYRSIKRRMKNKNNSGKCKSCLRMDGLAVVREFPVLESPIKGLPYYLWEPPPSALKP